MLDWVADWLADWQIDCGRGSQATFHKAAVWIHLHTLCKKLFANQTWTLEHAEFSLDKLGVDKLLLYFLN